MEDYDPQYGNNIDGCPADFVPWYDADYDGIQDHVDSCPTVKETYNKFQDEDGCPDLSPDGNVGVADTDGDGFPDYLDLCPTQSETFNGIDDTDGFLMMINLYLIVIKTEYLMIMTLVH